MASEQYVKGKKLWAVDLFEGIVHRYNNGEETVYCGMPIGVGGFEITDTVAPEKLKSLCKLCAEKVT